MKLMDSFAEHAILSGMNGRCESIPNITNHTKGNTKLSTFQIQLSGYRTLS